MTRFRPLLAATIGALIAMLALVLYFTPLTPKPEVQITAEKIKEPAKTTEATTTTTVPSTSPPTTTTGAEKVTGEATTTTTTKPRPSKELLQGRAGENLNNLAITFTVGSYRWEDRIDPTFLTYPYEARPGNWFLVLILTVENLRPTPYVFDPSFLEVSDTAGKRYRFDVDAFNVLGESFGRTRLEPGTRLRGQVAFQMPRDASAVNVTYNDKVEAELRVVFS